MSIDIDDPICQYCNNANRGISKPSCEICKGRLFDKKESKCPVCDRFVSKSDLLEKSPERRKIDKLIELRKRVLSIYNKKANNFKSLKEYDNYLEHIEDLVTGLYENNLEVENEVRNYEKQNQYEISKNREKEEEEKEKVTKIIEKEKDSINKLKEERLNEIELLKQQIIDENYKSQQEIGIFANRPNKRKRDKNDDERQSKRVEIYRFFSDLPTTTPKYEVSDEKKRKMGSSMVF